jgi:hypothetical protein
MQRILLICLLALAGCQNVNGPWKRPGPPPDVADPRLTIQQQEVLGRDRLALPQQSWDAGPRTFTEQPGYHGRY